MKILIVNRALGILFGGGESFDRNAARYLTKRGHQVTVVTGKPLFGPPKNRFNDLSIHYLPSADLRRVAYLTQNINNKLSAAFYHLDNLWFERNVLSWLSQDSRYRQFDVVQVCSLFWLAEKLLERWDLPVISWLPGIPSGLTRRRIRTLIINPHFGLFTHGDPMRFVQEKMRIKNFEVIEPGLELEQIDAIRGDRAELRQQLGLPKDSLLGITVCRLVPVKNVPFLLEGLALAMEKNHKLHHLLVGDGPLMGRLKSQATELGITSRVHFLGYCPNAEVHKLLAVSDFFVLTSIYENFSISTLEAMAHRLPVIATEVGYLQVLVKESGGGLLVPPEDAPALAEAIIRMAEDQYLRNKLGQNARAYAKQFDWPIIAEKLERLYREVVSV